MVCNDLRPFVFNSEYFNGLPRPPFGEQTVLCYEAKGFCVGAYENANLCTVKEAYLTYLYLSFASTLSISTHFLKNDRTMKYPESPQRAALSSVATAEQLMANGC